MGQPSLDNAAYERSLQDTTTKLEKLQQSERHRRARESFSREREGSPRKGSAGPRLPDQPGSNRSQNE